MGTIETGSRAFVVRIWVEEGAREGWRGHITEVTSGSHRYFTDLDEIVAFIRLFVPRWGADEADADRA